MGKHQVNLYLDSNNIVLKTGPTSSTRNQIVIQSDYTYKSKNVRKPDLTGNRWFNRKNWKPKWLNRFCKIDERDLQWSFILQKILFFLKSAILSG